MAADLVAVTFDAADPALLGRFWGGLLGREQATTADGVLLAGTATQVGLGFAPAAAQGGDRSERLHLHLNSETDADQRAIAAEILDRGGRHLDVGQLPQEGHVVLADPEGNPLCVLGPGSAFTAGCGQLSEVACDGTRDVGLFWAAALAWPLVWDQDEETAVQSPHGGTKLAWGGPPVEPKTGRNQQRFTLRATGDHAAEVERLVALGATRLDGDELADPDGNEFRLLSPA